MRLYIRNIIYKAKNFYAPIKLLSKHSYPIFFYLYTMLSQLCKIICCRLLPAAFLISGLIVTKSQAQGFALGADVGWLTQMESKGIKFYDDQLNAQDLFTILQQKGINAIRLRVWVNPSGGWNGVNDVVAKAIRAKQAGMRLLIDFHYSDSWADPGQQPIPAAWTAYGLDSLKQAVATHTTKVLQALRANNITPEWVQVGNEVNDGMLWELGRASTHMNNFAQLVLAGYNAVKAVDNSIKVVVHVSNGYNNTLFRYLFDGLKNNGAKWDVIGMSLYPSSFNWNSYCNQCFANMNDMVARYGSEIMAAEIGMSVSDSVACRGFIENMIANTKQVAKGKGIGVFYWEPEAYNNWQGYSLGAFNSKGQPTMAMNGYTDQATNYITNNSFDADSAAVSNPAGWTKSGDVAASYAANGNAWNPNGVYYLTNYSASSYKVYTQQTISIPNGVYQLLANTVRDSTHFNQCYAFATNYGGDTIKSNIIPNSNKWTMAIIPQIVVTNNQVTVGIYSDANAGGWLNVDNMTLSPVANTLANKLDINLTANLETNKQVKLQWQNNTGKALSYVVEYSTDGTHFKALATLKTTKTNLLNWTNTLVETNNRSYYRIKAIDATNTTFYSGVAIVVMSNKSTGLNIYPNPVTGQQCTIQVNNTSTFPVDYSVKDTMGNTKMRGQLWKANTVVYLPKLSSGMYFFKTDDTVKGIMVQ